MRLGKRLKIEAYLEQMMGIQEGLAYRGAFNSLEKTVIPCS